MRNCSRLVSIGLLVCACAATAFARGGQDGNKKKVEVRVEKKTIPPHVTYRFSREVGRGRLLRVQDGKPGVEKKTFKVTLKNGKEVGKELIKDEIAEPTDTLFLMGRDGYPSSRGSFVRTRVLDMVATAYTDSPSENGGSTRAANGTPLEYGVVAVDPRIIPIGTKLYIEGYGFAYAADTGSAIKGNRIDLCLPSSSACNAWGRRRVKVHVLSGRD